MLVLPKTKRNTKRSTMGMVARYDAAKAKYDETIAAISAKDAQNAWLKAFFKDLR